MSGTYRAYRSANYAVLSHPEGVEILNIPSNETQFLQGDDATELLGAIEMIPARMAYDKDLAPSAWDAKVTEATDYYLSQWFGNKLDA